MALRRGVFDTSQIIRFNASVQHWLQLLSQSYTLKKNIEKDACNSRIPVVSPIQYPIKITYMYYEQ